MIAFEKSIFINRPQQEVFDFVSNPANDPQWRSGAESAEWTSEGPVGVGSTYRSVDKLLGRKIEGTTEVTIWDPPPSVSKRPAGQFRSRAPSNLNPRRMARN